MLDSNADYIYDNELTDKVRKAVDDGKMKLFATDVQKQEIEEIPDDTRKQGIEQMAKKIRVKFIGTSAAVVALDQKGVRSFHGSRVDWAKVIDDNEKQLLEKITRKGMLSQLKNSADILTLFTAIKENMDYLVTDDIGFEKSLNKVKMEIETKLQIISYKDFDRWLDGQNLFTV